MRGARACLGLSQEGVWEAFMGGRHVRFFLSNRFQNINCSEPMEAAEHGGLFFILKILEAERETGAGLAHSRSLALLSLITRS